MARSVTLFLFSALSMLVPIQGGCSARSESLASRQQLLPAGRLMDRPAERLGFTALAEPAAESRRIASAQKPEVDPGRTERLVVYNAVLNILVERIFDSLAQIKSAVVEMGGYMQEMTSSSVTLKVPADRFNDAIAAAEKLGEVTHKEIKGTDVTEQMRDLDIRLRNAEQVREKLLKLLDRAENVEDALKVEKELERITETIEMLKGKISYLQNSVAFCALTILFNSPVPQKDVTAVTPFLWVHKLGAGLTSALPPNPRESSSFLHRSMFSPPEGYIRFYEDSEQTKAMSAAGVMIDAYKQKNYQGGSVNFWTELVRRVLAEQKVIRIEEQRELKLGDGTDCTAFFGSKQIGSKQYGYLVALAADNKRICVFEAWGPLEQFERDRGKIENAVKSMRLR